MKAYMQNMSSLIVKDTITPPFPLQTLVFPLKLRDYVHNMIDSKVK